MIDDVFMTLFGSFGRSVGRARPLLTGTAFLLLCAACGGDDGGGPGQTGWTRPAPPGTLTANIESRDLEPTVDGRDLTALVAGNTRFALELLGVLRQDAPNENVALGPYSISQAMAMLYAGARGETAAAMQSSLRFDVEPERFHQTMNGLDLELVSRNSDIVLRNANQAWVRTGFDVNPDYLDVLARDYGAPLAALDFAGGAEDARATINGWVDEVTEQKIPELFSEGAFDASTALVLTNAMYLDAPWKYEFDAKLTSKQRFTLLDGTDVDVDTMHFNDFLPTGAGDGWQAVAIPYRGDEVSMFVVVPDDLAAFEAALTPELLEEILGEIRDGGIHLSLPRFTFRFHAGLVEALAALGLDALFAGADLSGIAGSDLQVTAIEHEAFIEVDEEGTRAAAATGVEISDSHGPTVMVDSPFLFFIIDKPTRSVLFLGRVLDPR